MLEKILAQLLVDETLLTALIVAAVIILVLLFRNVSRSSEKRVDSKIIHTDKELDNYAREQLELVKKNNILYDRINYLSNKFPRELKKYGIRLHHGVTTYYKKQHISERNRYCFEDFISMNIQDYKTMCGMSLLFELRQDIKEDLSYIINNDITLLYSTDEIVNFFKEEYDFMDDMLNSIRKIIVLENWRLAAKDYKEVVMKIQN